MHGDCPPWTDQSTFTALDFSANVFVRATHNIAGIANNHILDCLDDGLASTAAALAGYGIDTVGAGDDLATACGPLQKTIGTLPVSVFSFLEMSPVRFEATDTAPGAAGWYACDGAAAVAARKQAGDFVVVALHLHLSRAAADTPAAAHLAIIEDALDAGADVVVAHGPHVPQSVIVRPGQIALASLGNFLFRPPYPLTDSTSRAVAAWLSVFADRLEVALVPYRMDEAGAPRLPTASDAETILGDLINASTSFDSDLTIRGHVAYATTQR